jgi:hypothetical protein
MLLACKSPFCAIASEVPLARSAATIVKVFMAVKSRIFYLLLHIGFSYPIGYPQAHIRAPLISISVRERDLLR